MRSDRHTDGRTDRQTDMTKLTVAFRNVTNASINLIWENDVEVFFK
jgi:hypothetical protein